jgi:hypothetical protein
MFLIGGRDMLICNHQHGGQSDGRVSTHCLPAKCGSKIPVAATKTLSLRLWLGWRCWSNAMTLIRAPPWRALPLMRLRRLRRWIGRRYRALRRGRSRRMCWAEARHFHRK